MTKSVKAIPMKAPCFCGAQLAFGEESGALVHTLPICAIYERLEVEEFLPLLRGHYQRMGKLPEAYSDPCGLDPAVARERYRCLAHVDALGEQGVEEGDSRTSAILAALHALIASGELAIDMKTRKKGAPP